MKEMTCNEFIQSMRLAGFSGTFIATQGNQTFKGTINQNSTVSTIKVATTDESRQKIKAMWQNENNA